ncbi:MAG: hypothetical protein KGM99_00965 [Burkholderiales bacterium]|nr:hypothetical protein [Burkholderiales bacterium]
MSNLSLNSTLSFIRWRLKIARNLTRIINKIIYLPKYFYVKNISSTISNSNKIFSTLEENGYAKVSHDLEVKAIDLLKLKGLAVNKSFIDIGPSHSIELVDAFAKLMSIEGVQDTIINYFSGRPKLWNVALNYSDPSDQVNDSQLWHFDYGDVRQLHFMIYFTDVNIDCGPFTFIDAKESAKVIRDAFILERFTDADLLQKFDINVQRSAIRLTGNIGDVYMADPGRILHQGARCKKPRLVMFVTFTTPTPMSSGGSAVIDSATRIKLWEGYKASCTPKLDKYTFI